MKNFALRTLSFAIIMSMFLSLLWGVDKEAARTISLDVDWVGVSEVNSSLNGDRWPLRPLEIEAAQ